MRKPKDKTAELLLEIGTEEVPYAYLDSLGGGGNNLGLLAEGYLEKALHQIREIACYQTPRRMVLHIQGLLPSYPIEEMAVGPKREICYSPDGKPTPALEGFLRRHQGTLKQLTEEEGRVVLRTTKRVVTREALKKALPELIRALSFPKMMRWDESDLRFPRPVRWLLCLYDGEVLRFRLGNLEAKGTTFGLGPDRKEKRITQVKDYFSFLKREGILLETCVVGQEGDRKRFVRQQLEKQLKKLGGSPAKINGSLLKEVTNLVERPMLFSGRLDRSTLKLPKEILIASLSKYQRLFSVEDEKGNLLPYFIACVNGNFSSLAKVRKNYEHVLTARLADATFFYEEDTREPLSSKRGPLKLLVYHQRLGTMYDKSERMKQMASHFADRLGVDGAGLVRACELSKNDLVTEMVKEFPSLQGVVGSYYITHSGESEEVAQAIREQYLPKGSIFDEFLPKEKRPQESLPESALGCALSVIEKLDHVVGCFYAGESPTGSSDPYGLKRGANALFKILFAKRWSISLEEMIEANTALLDRSLTAQKDRREKLSTFLKERLKGLFKEEGFREDLIDAVVEGWYHPVQIKGKLISLKQMMETQQGHFLSAFKVVERTHNILKPIPLKEREAMGGVRADLFQDDIEKRLWAIYNRDRDSIQKLIGEGAWAKATQRYGEVFFDILHQFFEKVLVNAEDQEVRRNRLAMMKEINELYTSPVADLSKLIMSSDQKTP